MTVNHVGAASWMTGARSRQGNQKQQYAVGQKVGLRVLRDLGGGRYLVAFGATQRVVESTVALVSDTTVQATVTAVGERLELKYLDARIGAAGLLDANASETVADPTLLALELRYATALRDADRQAIEQAMSSAASKAAMASAGLYLSKLSLPVDDDALQAVYLAQLWPAPVDAEPSELDSRAELENVVGLSSSAVAQLSSMLADALDPSGVEGSAAPVTQMGDEPIAQSIDLGSADAQGDDAHAQRDLAHRLLNAQDDGSLAYRYGVLPVLIGDQLVELDLVYFRERREAERAAGLRRLVMTFSTPTLGRVEILAQAIGDRLSIGINAENPQSSAALAAHADEVRDLARRLGWNVEVVSYESGSEPTRAAQHVVNHVLNADILSRLA